MLILNQLVDCVFARVCHIYHVDIFHLCTIKADWPKDYIGIHKYRQTRSVYWHDNNVTENSGCVLNKKENYIAKEVCYPNNM